VALLHWWPLQQVPQDCISSAKSAILYPNTIVSNHFDECRLFVDVTTCKGLIRIRGNCLLNIPHAGVEKTDPCCQRPRWQNPSYGPVMARDGTFGMAVLEVADEVETRQFGEGHPSVSAGLNRFELSTMQVAAARSMETRKNPAIPELH